MEKQISITEVGRARELRVDITEFKGHDLVGLRWYAEPDEGSKVERNSTKNGISFDVSNLPAVIFALQQVERAAREAGLIDADTPEKTQ